MIKMNLKNLMDKNNITQNQLSKDTKIGVNTICRYYNNKFSKIDKEHIDILCTYFDCSIGELLERI